MTRTALALLILLAPGAALAQARADGTYPGTLFCDALPSSGGPEREAITLDVASGRASYTRRLSRPGAGTETGSGSVAGGSLTLVGKGSGRGFSYEARYIGKISGRGGLLTGVQTWTQGGKSFRRACQMTVGDGLS